MNSSMQVSVSNFILTIKYIYKFITYKWAEKYNWKRSSICLKSFITTRIPMLSLLFGKLSILVCELIKNGLMNLTNTFCPNNFRFPDLRFAYLSLFSGPPTLTE